MAIIRYEPWSTFSQFQNELNKMFERHMSKDDNSLVETSAWNPLVDIKEEKDCFILFADVPGVPPEDIEISMEHNVLTIKGERKEEHKKVEKDNYSRIERVYGTFYRRFTLPDSVDPEHITATSKHGVLEVMIPKHERTKPRKIKIKCEDNL